MSDTTARLGLPYLAAAQAQKHVTVNAALGLLDTLVMLAVLDRDLAVPPGSPAEGARYIIPAGATGAWAGHAGAIAARQDGAWAFIEPRPGFLAYVIDEAALAVWDGGAWRAAGGGAPSVLDNMTRLGIGTAADTVNPFAAKLNNALWTAKTTAEGGDGTLRYKMNKESAGSTLSLLMQTAFSGRAEIGLTGDDDLHVKVSPDGSAWFEALRIERASGRVAFPASGGPRETLSGNRTYYVRPDGSDSNPGLVNSPAGAFLTIQKAINVACALDLSIYAVAIQVADGTYSPPSVVLKPYVGAGPITLVGNISTPANCMISTTGIAIDAVSNSCGTWRVSGFKLTSSVGDGIYAAFGSNVYFSNIDFGSVAAGAAQVTVSGNGVVTAASDYRISGGGARHVQCEAGGRCFLAGRAVTLSGTPAFSAFMTAARGASIDARLMTFSGAATGARYVVATNAVIDTGSSGSPTYFPGSSAGVTDATGAYT